MSLKQALRVRRPALVACAFVIASCAKHDGGTTPRQANTLGVPAGASVALHPSAGPSASPSPRHPAESPTLPSTYRCPEVLLAARKGGSTPDRYVTPRAAERAAMSKLFARLSKEAPQLLQAEAEAIGFVLSRVSEQPGVWSLVEAEGKRRGGGAYLLRASPSSRLIVQAPHTFFDEGTLPLACELFQRSGARALFIETAHRYKAAEASETGHFPADLAHAKDSLFQAASEGVVSEGEAKTLVQLHGFGPRESGANVVLSNGTLQPSALVDAAQQALAEVSEGVQRFPQETRELGATTNVQGELAREHGGLFLHVEISAPLRAKLLQDTKLCGRFLDALARGLEKQ